MNENSNGDRVRIGERVTIGRRGKRGIWTAEFWHDDAHRRLSLKTKDKRIAEAKARKIEVQLSEGQYGRVRTAAKIADAITAYLAHVKNNNRSDKTLGKYTHELKIFRCFCERHGVKRLDKVSMTFFDQFREELGSSLAPSTRYDYSEAVRQLYNFSLLREMIDKNPIKGCKLEKPERFTKPCPSLAQILSILAAATPRLARMIAFLAFTGLRSQNLKNLKKKDVDLDGGWIHIANRKGHETKTRHEWKVPIHLALEPYLRTVPRRPGDWYFSAEPSPAYPNGDHAIDQGDLNDDFKVVAARLGMPVGIKDGFTIHSLRRSFETIAINAGVPARVVDRWTGHFGRDRSMGNTHYYVLADDESKAFMKKIPFGNGKPAADAGE